MTAPAATPWRHLPNAISVVRVVLVVPLTAAILARRFDAALWLALVAALSDAFDGWLARRFSWRSRLGGMLDPAADKLLLVACYLALTHMGELPLWLALVVLGRDLVIVAGAAAYRWLVGPFKANPTRLSKYCTLVQILYVLAVLLGELAQPQLWLEPLAALVAVLTIASGIDYMFSWSRRARHRWPHKRTLDDDS